MKTLRTLSMTVLAPVALLGLGLGLGLGCGAATSHPVAEAKLGTASSPLAMEAVIDEPGPVAVETVVGAGWHVPLSGLLNLDHPEARAARLEDREETIHVAFHALHHPSRGTFLVDTGVERAIFEDPGSAAVRGLAAKFMHVGDMKRQTDTKSWIDAHGGRVSGVFLTHLHLDHVSGMRDVPAGTPVFVGPGETNERSFGNLFVAPSLDRALEGKPAISTLVFAPESDGVLDVFGDATVFAIHVPGHTAGSTAYVIRSPSGPVLLTGDACHTSWGWEHGVEPGTFSADKPKSAESLARLRALAARHPALDVRLGHQPLDRRVSASR